MEELKDGKVTVKQPAQASRFVQVAKSLQVAVFSNHLPQIEMLSNDRWQHYIIDERYTETDPNKRWEISMRSVAVTPITPL